MSLRSSSRSGLRLLLLCSACIVVPSADCQAPPGGNQPPLSLAQAISTALEHNQAIRAQRLNVDQAKAGRITAATKPNPVYNMTNEDFPVFSPKDMTFSNLRDNQEFLQSLSFTYERGGKRNQRIKVADDTTAVATGSVADAERQLRFQVSQAFIAILLAQSNLQFAQDNLKDFNQLVEINRSRLSAGDIAESDFLKITLQKLQVEQDVSAAQLAVVQGKAALRQLLGYENVAEGFNIAGTLEHKKYIVQLDELDRQALAGRPDLAAARDAVQLADDTATLARANRARDLTWEVEYKRAGTVNGLGFGASMELPIRDRNQGEIARSQVAARQARESESAVRVAALTDVVNAYSSFRTNEQVCSLYESGYLDQAAKSRDISQYAYTRGAASLLDLLDAERSYRDIQLAFRQALAAYMASVEQINMVVGQRVLE